jgi:hypothetical protein
MDWLFREWKTAYENYKYNKAQYMGQALVN